jgi:hypothetical protein
MRLVTVAGRGRSARFAGAIAPAASANRVSYQRGSVVEWYRNGPLGLEQGFTLARPVGRGVVRFDLVLSGGVAMRRRGSSVLLSRAGSEAVVARYGGLSATDATGRSLPARLAVRGRHVVLRVDTARARYPVRVDPFIQQGDKLTGTGESGGGKFGFATALSADGKTAVFGGPGDNGNLGAAWVFTRSGSTWTQQGGKLTPTGAVDDPSTGVGFGAAVALSADGNTAAISGPQDADEVGAVWVFTRSGQTWSLQGSKLTPDDGQGQPNMGAIALSADGNTLMAGGGGDNSGTGAVWVFTRSGQDWTQQGSKLTESGEQGHGEFGGSVGLSADGNTAVIGSPFDLADRGSALVFTRSGSTWSQGALLTSVSHGGDAVADFGLSVALSGDGSTALVGEPCYGRGAVWVFKHSGSGWVRQRELIISNKTQCYFGDRLALSTDGNTALVGAPVERNTHSTDNTGSAWLFGHTSGSNWSQIGSAITPSDETGQGLFGAGVALSSDATTALIGAPDDNQLDGAAWSFTRTGASCNYPNTIKASSGLTGYWRLGESSGNTAADSSSSGHGGTYTGGFTLGQPGAVLGDPNTSVSLNGTTGKVTLPSLGTASSWTIEGWTNLDTSAGNGPHGYNALYASGSGARLLIEPNAVYADDSTGGASAGHIDPSTDSNVGVWVFWALVRSGSGLTLYRNGVPIGSGSLSGRGPTSLNGAIGAQGSGYFLHGRADEVAVYSSALSASALESQYSCSGWG